MQNQILTPTLCCSFDDRFEFSRRAHHVFHVPFLQTQCYWSSIQPPEPIQGGRWGEYQHVWWIRPLSSFDHSYDTHTDRKLKSYVTQLRYPPPPQDCQCSMTSSLVFIVVIFRVRVDFPTDMSSEPLCLMHTFLSALLLADKHRLKSFWDVCWWKQSYFIYEVSV